uniref:Uncharacterized protein n=1 Tax=Cacopsylla melanoneura TaxID=428564 RepID=A0A8D8VG76_9HEMI
MSLYLEPLITHVHLFQIRFPSHNERSHGVIPLYIDPMIIYPHVLVAQLSGLCAGLCEQDLLSGSQMVVEENVAVFVSRNRRIQLFCREPFQVVAPHDLVVECSVVFV